MTKSVVSHNRVRPYSKTLGGGHFAADDGRDERKPPHRGHRRKDETHTRVGPETRGNLQANGTVCGSQYSEASGNSNQQRKAHTGILATSLGRGSAGLLAMVNFFVVDFEAPGGDVIAGNHHVRSPGFEPGLPAWRADVLDQTFLSERSGRRPHDPRRLPDRF